MAEFRWFLLAAGILVLGAVFWWSRREATGRPTFPGLPLKRAEPSMGAGAGDAMPPGPAVAPATAHTDRKGAGSGPIVAVRLAAPGGGTFGGEALVLALREAGLRHGKFGIFHRHDAADETRTLFGVASLVEPGSFDLERLRTDRYPGVSLFLALPTGGDDVAAFDDMLSTARRLASALDGEVRDDSGSRLSVQRERYLREEVIRFQHRSATQ